MGLETLQYDTCLCQIWCLYIEVKGRKCVFNDYIFTLTDSQSVCQNWFDRPNDSQMFITDEQNSRPKLVRYAELVFGCALYKSDFGIPKLFGMPKCSVKLYT